ncbi:MAG: glycosyltransferase [Methanomassiliicoccus sp.]|nr:glycosyltransferase [Methanomassiliicoccus sp.]
MDDSYMITEYDAISTERKVFPSVLSDDMNALNDRKGHKKCVLLSVIVPCYNEGDRIYKNLEECLRSLKSLGRPFEVIAVNDGSSDNTSLELNRLAVIHPEIIPVTYNNNVGKGNALRVGAIRASGDLIIFMDADLEIHPKHAAIFISTMERTGADMVIGSKRHPDSRVFYPLKRKFLSFGYHVLVRTLFGLKLTDTQPGFKLAKREVIEKEISKSKVNRYAFDLELLVNTDADGFKIVEAPIELDFSRPLGGRIGFRSVRSIFRETIFIYSMRKYYASISVKKNVPSNLMATSDQDLP